MVEANPDFQRRFETRPFVDCWSASSVLKGFGDPSRNSTG